MSAWIQETVVNHSSVDARSVKVNLGVQLPGFDALDLAADAFDFTAAVIGRC
jgi:hypothetical protein